MFIKPFKVRTHIQMKGSEKKKLKTRIQNKYPNINEIELNNLICGKSCVCIIKATSFNETPVNIYTVDKRPMFFELQDNLLYPTVYTLWLYTDLVPIFTTHSGVLPKLSNGADLMLPGVVREAGDLKSWGRFQKHDVVAVNLTSNKAAVGMGILARSSEDLYMSGGTGICVKMLHVFGDKLWGMEPTVCKQIPLLDPALTAPKASDFPPLCEELPEKDHKVVSKKPISKLNRKDIDFPPLGGVSTDVSDNSKVEGEFVEIIIQTANLDCTEVIDAENEISNNKSDLDSILKNAFLTTIKTQGGKITLPILTSSFYPQYVQTGLAEPIEVKHTTYKKVSTFLQAMCDEGFITIKEEIKGVAKITDINLDHPGIQQFIPLRKKNNTENNSVVNEPQRLLTKMTELYAVNEETISLFSNFNLQVGKALDSTQVKNYVKDYVGRNKLVDNATKMINLDRVLTDVCNAEGSIGLDRIINAVISKMTITFEMRSQQAPITKSGKKPIIQITTATRSGNKKVTLIANLDAYGINIPEFLKECKVKLATSCTMTAIKGQKDEQLLLQGNHVKFIYDLLTMTYKIPKQSITGLEFAKKEKKKK